MVEETFEPGDPPMTADTAPAADVQPKAKIFISYSRKDMAFADRLEAALKARGFEPLIDRTEIYAFEDWWKRIEALIGRADTVVFVLSPDAVASDVALKEVAHAASLNKRFAPIVCRRTDDGAVPEALRRLNFIFFDDPARFEASADQLGRGAADRHRLGPAAHRIRRSGKALGGRRPDRRAVAALAGAGGGGALDRVAPARRAGADGGDPGICSRQPARNDQAAQHSHRQPCGRPRGCARACRTGLLATRGCGRSSGRSPTSSASAPKTRSPPRPRPRTALCSTWRSGSVIRVGIPANSGQRHSRPGTRTPGSAHQIRTGDAGPQAQRGRGAR